MNSLPFRYSPKAYPTVTERLEVLAPAIVATCRSLLNTSCPVRALGDYVIPEIIEPRKGRAMGPKVTWRLRKSIEERRKLRYRG